MNHFNNETRSSFISSDFPLHAYFIKIMSKGVRAAAEWLIADVQALYLPQSAMQVTNNSLLWMLNSFVFNPSRLAWLSSLQCCNSVGFSRLVLEMRNFLSGSAEKERWVTYCQRFLHNHYWSVCFSFSLRSLTSFWRMMLVQLMIFRS